LGGPLRSAAAPARLEALSLPCPEVECIGKGKTAAPYEFGIKASMLTKNRPAPGDQFMLHAEALPDNP
jgi:IS5 family transposase